MPDLPKKEFDELFREGASMQQFEYNEAAWNKMEDMLDNDDKNRRFAIWAFVLVGIVLATMAGLWYASLDTNTSHANINKYTVLNDSDSSIENVEQVYKETQNVINEEQAETAESKKEVVVDDIISQEKSSIIEYSNNDSNIEISESTVNSSISSTEQSIDTTSEIAGDNSTFLNKLSFSVFAAPEWSSVGINGNRKRGYKFGGRIGYQIANKWELSTGLAISQKRFNGKGSEFTVSEGWIDDIMPMTMDGKCNIIEIPLDVVYYHSGVGNTGFVASAGLRSFMLHSEWYGFEYNRFYDDMPNLLRDKTMENANKNWLGSLELSVGYSQRISKSLSLQISPYLQLPVTGFGDGKINLYSGGIQFAARFEGKKTK